MVVPVIDLHGIGTDRARRLAAAREIDEACRDIGFFTVVNHGVPATVDHACWRAARAFFDLPAAARQAVAFPYPGYPYGYAGLASETLAQSRGTAGPPDLKESFCIGPLRRPERPRGRKGEDEPEAFAYADNLWPAALPGFRAAWEAYYRAMAGLAHRLMRLFALGLGLEEGYFDDKIDRHISALRALNYPDQRGPPVPGQLRAGVHSDYGSLTILRQEAKPGGLEVLTREGDWLPVPDIPGGYVVNIGDLMATWTNDRWVSTLHRVVNPPPDAAGSTRRQSLAFFHQPNWDAEIRCLPTCLAPGARPYHAAVTSGAYLMSKFRSTLESIDSELEDSDLEGAR